MDELMHTLERVSAKKTQLDAARPLSPSALNRLHEQLDVEWTYGLVQTAKNLVSLTEACVLTV